MAYGCNADDDYHQLGMYSMINGIEVKIGEKFKVPDKVLLPIGWKPSDPCELLQFEYDFWKENEVIQRAEEERLTQVQMTSNIENEEKEDTPVDSETGGVDDDDKEDDVDDESPNTSSESNVNEILTPFVMPSEGVENKCSETHKKINLEEFEEDKNQNPFELVELQTLDEYDELRSVLEPGKKEKKVIKSKCSSNNYENFELDANFFNNVDVAKPVTPVASVLNYSDDQSNPVGEPVKTIPDDFNIPEHIAKGTLNWTKFNKDSLAYRGCDPAVRQMYTQSIDQMSQSMSNMQINGQIPTVATNQSNVQVATSVSNEQMPLMQPGVMTTVYNPGMMSQSVTNIPNATMNTEIANDDIQINNSNLSYGQRLFMTDDLQQTKRTKSMPDLEGMTDKSQTPNEVVFNNNLSPMEPNQLRFNIDNSQSDNVVRTDRIDSIMKQYQFQRLSNMPVTVSSLPQANVSNVSSVNMPNVPQASVSNVPQAMPQGSVNMSAASNYNSASNIPNIGTNMTQYVGLPGYTSQPVSTMTTESYPKPVQPGIHPNIPVSSLPSPVIPNSSLNRTQVPTSAFNIQGMPVNVSNTNISSTTNYPVGNNIPIGVNPFSQPNLQNQNNTQIPTSMYRHGVLPPLPGERSHVVGGFNPVVSQPLPYNPSYVMSSATPLPDTDIRASPSPRIPNIPSQECYNPNINGMRNTPMPSQERSSWLVDPIEELSINQKNFAYQIAAMGFSLPCVARTVMRVGIDEKEVLDFLCSVQDLKEKDYDSDDVEMALLNLQNEKEKVPSYLEMVNTLRELGFKPSDIHNALIKTSVDQNKAIDYLTSSR